MEMKKIIIEIEKIMVRGTYNDYRLIVTPRHIELKLRPVLDSDDEINFSVPNNKEKRLELYYTLSEQF